MGAPRDIGESAYAARIAERLSSPAAAILGYQELIVEEVRENGPADALEDLERVLGAARDLNVLIDRLLAGGGVEPAGAEDEARLRHDLRTPMNAILGYSEMVLEDLADDLPARLVEDIETVRRESRTLLGQIDEIVGRAVSETPAAVADTLDLSIAAQFARTLAVPDAADGGTGRILVVDDVRANRDLLARRLRREGHTVTTAASGRAALQQLAEAEFDLLLLDILMPDMNGLELLGRLKADDRLREIPVLMVSSLRDDKAVLRCIAAGAEDYLPKPVDAVLLRARISACLERRRWREREKLYLARIQAEKERASALLHAVLPEQVVRRLDGGEEIIADRFEAATIVFADIVGFTPVAARTTPSELVQRLGALFSRFDDLADRHGVEKIKTIGDAYMAAAGLPDPRPDHAEAAVAFALALLAEAARAERAGPALALRIGVHSGPVVAGLIGRKRFVYDVWGHTVNLASRLEATGEPGHVHLSASTLGALGALGAATARPRGEVELKGIGAIATYLIEHDRTSRLSGSRDRS